MLNAILTKQSKDSKRLAHFAWGGCKAARRASWKRVPSNSGLKNQQKEGKKERKNSRQRSSGGGQEVGKEESEWDTTLGVWEDSKGDTVAQVQNWGEEDTATHRCPISSLHATWLPHKLLAASMAPGTRASLQNSDDLSLCKAPGSGSRLFPGIQWQRLLDRSGNQSHS